MNNLFQRQYQYQLQYQYTTVVLFIILTPCIYKHSPSHPRHISPHIPQFNSRHPSIPPHPFIKPVVPSSPIHCHCHVTNHKQQTTNNKHKTIRNNHYKPITNSIYHNQSQSTTINQKRSQSIASNRKLPLSTSRHPKIIQYHL